MSLNISTEYKGYLIEWSDFRRKFNISLDGKSVKQDVSTLEECAKWIDSKLKQKFKRISIICRERWGNNKTIEGEATSAIDDEYVWVVAKNGERSKVKASDIWLATPNNIEVLKQIRDKESDICKLQSEIRALSDATERLTIAMMIEG